MDDNDECRYFDAGHPVPVRRLVLVSLLSFLAIIKSNNNATEV